MFNFSILAAFKIKIFPQLDTEPFQLINNRFYWIVYNRHDFLSMLAHPTEKNWIYSTQSQSSKIDRFCKFRVLFV